MARDKAHTRYKLGDGTAVPGATTVLGILNKPALVKWSNNLGLAGIDVSKYVDDKAAIGTLGHALITDHYAGRETDTSDYSANQIDAATNSALSFWEWVRGHPIKRAILVEKPLVSKAHGYGGTPDLVVEMADGSENAFPTKELIDLKTGKGIWPEHVWQGATYRMLLREHGYVVDRVRILNIPRSEDESFVEKVLSEKELETGWQIFLHCLAIYNLQKGR